MAELAGEKPPRLGLHLSGPGGLLDYPVAELALYLYSRASDISLFGLLSRSHIKDSF